jgi:hypothetical protein
MKRSIAIAASVALGVGIVGVGAAAAKPDGLPSPEQVAGKACNDEQKAVGARTFRQIHGKHAMRDCKRAAREEAQETIRNASQECRAERETLGEEAFAQQYGTNANGRNAFGKCVSSKVTEEVAEDVEATENAAKQCKAEREELGEEPFAEQYGTNANKRNAFGKCVSQKAKALNSATS